jgi:hypothetical protein
MPESHDLMPPLQLQDIQPGLIVRVDTEVLRLRGDSRTNAQATATEDRAVTGVHDFLVLLVDAAKREVLALPLFPRSAPGSAPLDDTLRTGPAEWLAAPVYYSRWQHWQVPLDALIAASAPDEGERRTYATGKAEVLRDLANWASRNRCAFRAA